MTANRKKWHIFSRFNLMNENECVLMYYGSSRCLMGSLHDEIWAATLQKPELFQTTQLSQLGKVYPNTRQPEGLQSTSNSDEMNSILIAWN